MKVILEPDFQGSAVTGHTGICRKAIGADRTYREQRLCLRWPGVGRGSRESEQRGRESGRKGKV